MRTESRMWEWSSSSMTVDLLSLQTLLCCLAFFFAGIVDSITGGGGLITIPAMLAIKNGARIIRPIMFCVVALLIIKLVIERGP